MESQDNNQPKKPASSGFNSYWIYGILFLALIGINFFYLANAYGFKDADHEDLIATRDW